jgi:FtsZ-binding cell division protein ZapB
LSKPSNLEILEKKIGLAVDKITTLGSENHKLRDQNSALEAQVKEVEGSRQQLELQHAESQRLLNESQGRGAELLAVRKHVDSILEKFERLDL